MSGNGIVLVVQILLVAIVAVFVISPIVRRRGERAWSESREEALRRSIAERKGRLYTSILELDFDRDSGKLSPEDHGRMRNEAMNEALVLLKEEEALEKGPRSRPAVIEGGDAVERAIEEYKRSRRRDPGARQT